MIENHRNKLKVQHKLHHELDDKPEDDIYVKECKKYGINPDFY
jgi:hypothetical protein